MTLCGPIRAEWLKPWVRAELQDRQAFGYEVLYGVNGEETHLTGTGIGYLQNLVRLGTPEHKLFRASYRAGLTSTQPESKVGDMASIRSTKSRAAELRAEADRLAAERELVLARIAVAEAAASKFDEPAPGSKVLIEARFPGGGHKYEYLAMRTENPRSVGDNWYITGQKGKTNWSAILHLIENAREVEIYDLDFRR